MSNFMRGCTDGTATTTTSIIALGGTECSGIELNPNAKDVAVWLPSNLTGGNVYLQMSRDGGTNWFNVESPGQETDTTKRRITPAAGASSYVKIGWRVLSCQGGGGNDDYVPLKVRVKADTSQAAACTIYWDIWTNI